MKKLMILGASILQLPAIEKAREMGIYTIALDMNPLSVGFSRADLALPISTIDEQAVLDAARQHHIDGIMTLASDMPMRSVARVATELGLPGIDPDTALRATNKRAMREALRDAGVPVPAFLRATDAVSFLDAVRKIGADRFIVKPADNSGSRGVSLVSVSDGEQAALIACQRALDNARTGEILIEEYMQGPEVSVEAISVDGDPYILAITDKLTTGAPYFVEMGHSEPSRLHPEAQADIRRTTERAIRAIGIRSGPSHTELIVTDRGAKIVELGARLGGDNITTHLVPLSTGIDMVKASIQIALGEAPDLTPTLNMGAAIRYAQADPGVIESILGVERARDIEGVVQLSFTRGAGELAPEIRSSLDRIGFVIARLGTPQAAVEACERALSLLKVNTE